MINKKISIALLAAGMMFVSCSKDDGPAPAPPIEMANLKVQVLGLQDLGASYEYEGWIIVDGKPISTGKFSSVASDQTFSTVKADLDKATDFVLSIEPKVGDTPEPSATKILSGKFQGNLATVNSSEVVGDFSGTVSGSFLLAAPTSDTPAVDAKSGVWFGKVGGTPGLVLPQLASGWKYEGWVVFKDNTGNDFPLSTGTFTDPNVPDEKNTFGGTGINKDNAPKVPGEDFLIEPDFFPGGLTLPNDITGKQVVISIEPAPDEENLIPFFLKPLAATAGSTVLVDNPMQVDLAVFPSGRVTR